MTSIDAVNVILAHINEQHVPTREAYQAILDHLERGEPAGANEVRLRQRFECTIIGLLIAGCPGYGKQQRQRKRVRRHCRFGQQQRKRQRAVGRRQRRE